MIDMTRIFMFLFKVASTEPSSLRLMCKLRWLTCCWNPSSRQHPLFYLSTDFLLSLVVDLAVSSFCINIKATLVGGFAIVEQPDCEFDSPSIH